MDTAESLARQVGVRPACEALAVSRASYYRRLARRESPPRPRSAAPPPLALSPQEREEVLGQLHSPRFVDAAPRQVWASLLDENIYLCSVRTMYRILAAEGEVRERRNQLRHPSYEKPELLATCPNQLWSWDITKLKGPRKWNHFYLYVILDVYSRYVVGWMVAHRESEHLARRLIRDTLAKQEVTKQQLTLHADRGASMTSKSVAHLLADMGVTKTHSRPYTSNDNPYSESQFKTLKYSPGFPDRFGSQEDARGFCARFFSWYNTEHHHSGLAMLTPEEVHYGRAQQTLARRAETLKAAYAAHPHRFKGKMPQPGNLPDAVWINPPAQPQETTEEPQ